MLAIAASCQAIPARAQASSRLETAGSTIVGRARLGQPMTDPIKQRVARRQHHAPLLRAAAPQAVDQGRDVVADREAFHSCRPEQFQMAPPPAMNVANSRAVRAIGPSRSTPDASRPMRVTGYFSVILYNI